MIFKGGVGEFGGSRGDRCERLPGRPRDPGAPLLGGGGGAGGGPGAAADGGTPQPQKVPRLVAGDCRAGGLAGGLLAAGGPSASRNPARGGSEQRRGRSPP